MKIGFKIGKQEKALFTVLISIILIVVIAVVSGKNIQIKGAAVVDDSQPLLNLKMDSNPFSEKEVLDFRGVRETDSFKGKVKNAWKFDGKNDYVITSSNHLKELEDFTIMFWFKPSDSSLRKRAHLVWQGEINEDNPAVYAGNGWGKEQEMHLSLGDELSTNKYSDHQLTFYLGDERNNLKVYTPIKFIDWQHVAVTVRNHNNWAVAELFLNGLSVDKHRIENNINQDKWDSTLNLGRAGMDGPATDSNRLYDGMLDELTIHDRVLTNREISNGCKEQNDGDFCS